MFSFLQFISSPLYGGISDVVGRRKVMLGCLMGISLSYLIWILSSNLLLFIIARFIGGLSKGNVSLSMAIVTDVSTMKTRAKGMALIGIAFSLGFIVGPMIGALFSIWAKQKTGDWFVYPATFALLLSLTDLMFFSIFFKETLKKEKQAKTLSLTLKQAKSFISISDIFNFVAVTNIKPSNLVELKKLGIIYFVYLFIYSGLEFTLTFLTHHVFKYSSMQQGWMFFGIGVTMALIQGGYVRRIPQNRIKSTATTGLWLIIPSFVCIGLAREFYLLAFGLFLFALSTALVVPCITTIVSQYGDEHQKGIVMGIFRSLGALARASGPILASILFWSIGSTLTYLIGAIFLFWPVIALRKL